MFDSNVLQDLKTTTNVKNVNTLLLLCIKEALLYGRWSRFSIEIKNMFFIIH